MAVGYDTQATQASSGAVSTLTISGFDPAAGANAEYACCVNDDEGVTVTATSDGNAMAEVFALQLLGGSPPTRGRMTVFEIGNPTVTAHDIVFTLSAAQECVGTVFSATGVDTAALSDGIQTVANRGAGDITPADVTTEVGDMTFSYCGGKSTLQTIATGTGADQTQQGTQIIGDNAESVMGNSTTTLATHAWDTGPVNRTRGVVAWNSNQAAVAAEVLPRNRRAVTPVILPNPRARYG